MRAADEIRVAARSVTVEAFVAVGGRADYGLIGAAFEPDGGSELRIEVPFIGDDGEPWDASLALEIDEVHLGLPAEYAPAVTGTFASCAAGRLPAASCSSQKPRTV